MHEDDKNDGWTYKVDLLLEAVRQASSKYYTPQTNVSIDEAMIRFCGRSRDTFKMPNKPIGEGYKAFCLADRGYLFDFRMASRSQSTPGVEDIDNLSRTSSTVLSLAMSLPYQHQAFVIYMDNYFNNVPLFLKLRKLGIGACETARQNCSGFPKELKVGKTLTGKQKLDYHFITGMEVGMTASNRGVLAVLWMDNAPVTMLTTVHNIHGSKSHVITERKCSRDTSSNAAGVQQLFKQGEFVKPLSIPTCVDDYNQFMGGVDITDQYHSYYTTQIVARRNWLPIFFWILDTALLNSFIIYQEFFNSKAEDSCPFSHKEFNVEVAWNWILQGQNNRPDKPPATTPDTEKQNYVKDGTSLPSAKSRLEGRHLPIVGKRGVCFWCRWKARNSGTQDNSNNFPRSSFICGSCNLHLCISTERNCFEAFHTV